jgi:hypothetical protein
MLIFLVLLVAGLKIIGFPRLFGRL